MSTNSGKSHRGHGSHQSLVISISLVVLAVVVGALVLSNIGDDPKNESKVTQSPASQAQRQQNTPTPAPSGVGTKFSCAHDGILMSIAPLTSPVSFPVGAARADITAISVIVCIADLVPSADPKALAGKIAELALGAPVPGTAQEVDVWAKTIVTSAIESSEFLNGDTAHLNTGRKFEIALETSLGSMLVDQDAAPKRTS